MTLDQPTCACGQPLTGAAICTGCEQRLIAALRNIPALVTELDVVLTRQAKQGGASIGYVSGTSTRPLPYDAKASEVMSNLKAVLVGWVRNAVDARADMRPEGPACGYCGHMTCCVIRSHDWPADRASSLSRYLLRHMAWLRNYEPASEAVDEITHTVAAVHRVAYRERVQTAYAGICSARTLSELGTAMPMCPADLYAKVGAGSVTCQMCGTEHDMSERRRVLMEAVEDQLCTAAELTTAVSTIARPISGGTIRSWVSRERLAKHGANAKGAALYRVGDVLDLLAGDETRRKSA